MQSLIRLLSQGTTSTTKIRIATIPRIPLITLIMRLVTKITTITTIIKLNTILKIPTTIMRTIMITKTTKISRTTTKESQYIVRTIPLMRIITSTLKVTNIHLLTMSIINITMTNIT